MQMTISLNTVLMIHKVQNLPSKKSHQNSSSKHRLTISSQSNPHKLSPMANTLPIIKKLRNSNGMHSLTIRSLSKPHKPNPVATTLSNKNPLPIRIPSNLNPLAKTSLSNNKLEISNSKPQINPLEGRTPTSLISNRTQLF